MKQWWFIIISPHLMPGMGSEELPFDPLRFVTVQEGPLGAGASQLPQNMPRINQINHPRHHHFHWCYVYHPDIEKPSPVLVVKWQWLCNMVTLFPALGLSVQRIGCQISGPRMASLPLGTMGTMGTTPRYLEHAGRLRISHPGSKSSSWTQHLLQHVLNDWPNSAKFAKP